MKVWDDETMTDNTKQKVREFYDEVGWIQEDGGLYQNARYEDLRPVSREYIHKCHLRVNRHLAAKGDLLLDAGSGPVQWPEYLTYSQNYGHRLCADISITALKEARTRLGDKGLYVVADIANLPFVPDAFDGIVSMHTIHHIPFSEHRKAYMELYRVLKPGRSAVVVNGWYRPLIARITRPLIQLQRILTRRSSLKHSEEDPSGTFVNKMTPAWFKSEFSSSFAYEIRVWRSLSPRILVNFINPRLGGKIILNIVYWLEERFPRLFGRIGIYPLIVIKK